MALSYSIQPTLTVAAERCGRSRTIFAIDAAASPARRSPKFSRNISARPSRRRVEPNCHPFEKQIAKNRSNPVRGEARQIGAEHADNSDESGYFRCDPRASWCWSPRARCRAMFVRVKKIGAGAYLSGRMRVGHRPCPRRSYCLHSADLRTILRKMVSDILRPSRFPSQ